MNHPLPPAVFLMGPTASGKTGVAAALLKRFPFEIISVDSALVYRGMDIGTAKPDAGLLQAAPHRLIDIRDPADTYSAAEFREDALREMAGIVANGNIPLLVGGTMLYFRALEQGLSAMPPADPEIRAALEQEMQEEGLESLYRRLQQVDPRAAARIHANDPQRIQRALEVYEMTGQPLSNFHAQGRELPLPYRLVKVILAPGDRVRMQQRIERRFREMLEAGLVDEVRELVERGDLDGDVPALRAVGYRQVRAFLAGGLSYDEMVNQAIVATRQYAKRQLTWLRREENVRWFAAEEDSVVERIGDYLECCLKQ
ncbi:MAG: tRNA (adenosine(37)-N6)-dimethylallyltransferase MiaA [Gammaproteobacteria bacterium]|nr:MAG: tRNA (adenosine(37)-N6)-dimethylallyltransferase MiaA [Gammaproteobacteria bacterium]